MRTLFLTCLFGLLSSTAYAADDAALKLLFHNPAINATMEDTGTPNTGTPSLVGGNSGPDDPDASAASWQPDGVIDADGDGEITTAEVNAYTERVKNEADKATAAILREALRGQIKAAKDGGAPLPQGYFQEVPEDPNYAPAPPPEPVTETPPPQTETPPDPNGPPAKVPS